MRTGPSTGMIEAPAIQVRNLAFAYPGGFALRVPEFHLGGTERVAIVGPSGSGKTTLLRLIAGIAVPDWGTVELDGTEIAGLSDRERRALRAARIGFVFQGVELLDHLTVRDNILYPVLVSDRLAFDRAVRARAEALAEAAGIGPLLRRRPAALSQGERQRVAICRALIARPRIVLADEPTGNLDPEAKGLILDLLFDRAREEGAALLVVTHDHALLPRFDRVVDFAAFRARGAA